MPARLVALCFATFMCVSTPSKVDAATQGQIGFGSSAGSVDIDLIVLLRTRIAGLSDFALGDWSGSGPLTADDNICVGVNFTAGPYRIRASGDGEPGDPAAFTLSNGATQIKYNVFFNDFPSLVGRVPLTGGVTLTGQTLPNGPFFPNFFGAFNLFSASGCRVNTSNVSIEVPESELAGGFGTYNGTLTLTLLPE